MTNFLQKHKHIFIMGLIFCLVFCVFFAVRVFSLSGLSLKTQTTKFNTVTDAATPTLENNDKIIQSFYSDRKITAIAVLPDMRKAKSGASFDLTAYLADGTLIASSSASADYTADEYPPYLVFNLDVPIETQLHAQIYLSITAHTQANETVSFYISKAKQSSLNGGVAGAPESQLYYNETPIDGSLTLTAQTCSIQGFITIFFVGLAFLCAVSLCLIYAFVFIFKKPIEQVFLVCAICFGIIYMVVIPPHGATDEKQHIQQAFNNSARIMGIENEIGWGGNIRRSTDYNSTIEENATTVFTYKEIAENFFTITDSSAFEEVWYYGEEVGGYQLPYLPSTLGVTLARILHLGYVPTLYLGRIFTFAVFVAMAFFAIKLAPFGKAIFAVVSLLPSTIHVAASFSRDSFTMGGAFLLTALTLFASTKKDKIKLFEAIGIAVLCILFAPSKAAYLPLVLLMFIVPTKRFNSVVHAYVYKIGTILCAVILYLSQNSIIIGNAAALGAFVAFGGLISVLSLAPVSASAMGIFSAISIGTPIALASVNPDLIVYTVPYILQNIMQSVALLVNSVVENGAHYIYQLLGGTLGNDNLPISWAFISVFFVFVVLATQCDGGTDVLRKAKNAIPAWLAFLGCCGLVVAGCILWTPTYYTTIYGLQGRYFLPMLPLLLLLVKPISAKATSETKLLFYMMCTQALTVLNIFYVVAKR